ncbi:MAG TPA: hypothetical protein VF531_02535 [Bacillota bacterium]
MNIASTTSGLSGSILTTGYNDNTLTQLEKEKSDLEAQLQKEQASQTDAQTKQQKIEQLQNQINQIEIRINQQKAAQQNKVADSFGDDSSAGSDSTLRTSSTQIDIKI